MTPPVVTAVVEWLAAPMPADPLVIVVAYTASLLASLVIAFAGHQFGVYRRGMPFDLTVGAVVIVVVLGPLAEELLFRGVPLLVHEAGWGGGLAAGIYLGSVVWLVLHGWRAPALTPYMVFYAKLWLAGLWPLAIAFHMFHNGWVFAWMYVGERRDATDTVTGPMSGTGSGDERSPTTVGEAYPEYFSHVDHNHDDRDND